MTIELRLFNSLSPVSTLKVKLSGINHLSAKKYASFPQRTFKEIFCFLYFRVYSEISGFIVFFSCSACFLLSGYLPKQRLLTEVPLTFSTVKSRSFTCPKMLLQIFQDQSLVFRWSAFPMSQAMYQTKFWTSQNGSQS